MKAILMSIKPRFVADILNGDKTIEVRKRFPLNYRGWVYIYCTKEKPYLYKDYDSETTGDKVFTNTEKPLPNEEQYLGGKVVARFYCKNVERIPPLWQWKTCWFNWKEWLINEGRISPKELFNYLNRDDSQHSGYAIPILLLEIFYESKELSEFQGTCASCEAHKLKVCKLNREKCDRHLTKAPQSWQYIEVE